MSNCDRSWDLGQQPGLVLSNDTELLYSLLLAIRAAPTLERALLAVVQQVCQYANWHLGEVWVPNPAGTALVCSPTWYSAASSQLQSFRSLSEQLVFLPGVGLPGRVWLNRQPEWCPDLSRSPSGLFMRAEAATDHGFRAALGVPLCNDRQVLAVLVFFLQQPQPSECLLTTRVSTVMSQLAVVMNLKQAELALQDNQRQMQRLIDSLPGIIFSAADSGTGEWLMTYLSEGCFKLTGYHSWELIGSQAVTSYGALTHADDLSRVMQAIRVALLQQQPYVVEYRLHTRSGQERWLWEKGYAVLDAEGQVCCIEGFISDITDRKRTEQALRQTESKYRSIFENAVEGMFQTTPEGRYLTANSMLARIYGYRSVAELVESLTDIQHQLYVNPQRRADFVHLMQQQGAVWGFESEIYRQDGSIIWISECARALYDDEGRLAGYEGTVEDITRRKQAEAELRRQEVLLQGIARAINCLLTNPQLAAAVPEVLSILGQTTGADRVYLFEIDAGQDQPLMKLQFEWAQAAIQPLMQQPDWQNRSFNNALQRWYESFQQGQPIIGLVETFPASEQALLRQNGVLSMLLLPVFADGQLWGFIGFDQCSKGHYWTVSEESILATIATSIGAAIKRQRTEEQMRHQAFHDALTGLPNRMLFNHSLPRAIAQAEQTGSLLAVLFLDLDRFKTINDTLGHAVGDRLLQQVSQRLAACLREEDIIARWGGDEFTLLLPNLKSPCDAAKIAQRLAAVLQPAFELQGHSLHISSSIGIAIYPQNGRDSQSLLKNADAALYRVKADGRNNYQFYTAALNSQASELLTLSSSLHHALERNEFVVYYQPQINVVTGEVTQMEALLRWQHPQLGVVSPKTFIRLAEENGTIVAIGEWVLQAACLQNQRWQTEGLLPVRVAVNLSACQFRQPQLVDRVRQVLAATQLDPTLLELEITETAAMHDIDATTAILHELRALGVRIAMDDFGTGYSSLGYLKKFPLNTLKIDQSFVHDLSINPDDEAIVTAVIALGQGLNLNVVAEGVETQAQAERLRLLQCSEMQGYWFSPPLNAAAATQFLQRQQARFSPSWT